MSAPAFPAAIAAALDRFTVPHMPADFADRLIERAKLRQAIAEPLPATPRRRASPWARVGRLTATIGAISLFTAAAAAGGLFGDKVYVPGITEVMEHTQIIAPRHKAEAKHAAQIANALPLATTPPAPLTGQAQAKAELDRLRADPAFKALPPKQKMRTALRETHKLVQSGAVTKQEARAAFKQTARENYQQMTPEEQAQAKQRWKRWKQQRDLRREARQNWREQHPAPEALPN